MSIEDFKMYEDWSKYRETLKDKPVVAPKPVVLATWGRRFGAYLIDNLLLSVPLGFYVFTSVSEQISSQALLATADPVTGEPDAAAMQSFMGSMVALQLKVYLIFVGLATLYYVVCHSTVGQTVGKMAVGIRLIRDDGSKVTWGVALKRALINPIVQLVPLAGGLVSILNGLWPLWDDKCQSLGDKVARTLVVDA